MPKVDREPEPSLPPARDRQRVLRAQECLKDLKSSSDEVSCALAALSEHDLETFGLSSFFLNLLAVFAPKHSPQSVRRLAVAALRNKLWNGWEYYSYLAHLEDKPRTSPSPRLGRLDSPTLESLRASARGTVVCSFHFGDYRDIASDLALHEIPSVLPLDREGFDQFVEIMKRIAERRIHDYLHAVDVEKPRAAITLARALSAGKVVVAYVDGNTGFDGPMGDSSRTDLTLFGYTARVKNGLARLAGRLGCPLLPVLAPRFAGHGRWQVGAPITPGRPLRGSDLRSFADEATRSLYARFERAVLESPELWETACFFHRWRTRPESIALNPEDLTQASRLIREELAAGHVVNLDPNRVVLVGRDETAAFLDVHTLRIHRPSPADRWLITALAPGGIGFSLEALRRQSGSRSGVAELPSTLIRLQACELLMTSKPGTRSTTRLQPEPSRRRSSLS